LQRRPAISGLWQRQHIGQQLQALEASGIEPAEPLAHLLPIHCHQIHLLALVGQHHQMELVHVGGDLLLQQVGEGRRRLAVVAPRQGDAAEDQIAARHQGDHGAAASALLQLAQRVS